jgi:molybdate transport system regulatory protein
MHIGSNITGSMFTHSKKHRPFCRIWLEYKGEPVIGKGGAQILDAIREVKSISKAASRIGMSYRYVWNYLAKIEKTLQKPILQTYKGGSKGGGGAVLTKLGEDLLREYKRVEGYVGETLGDEEYWEAVGLKISARNRLGGTVQKVDKGVITAKVRIKTEKPVVVTAIISKEAVEELDIKPGDKVEAVIKATEVMVAKER